MYNFSFFVWGLFFSWEEATISWVDVKGELDDPPLVKRSRKLHLQLKVGKSVFQQKSISPGEKQCSISFRNCSPIVGKKESYHRTPGMQSLCHCTKARENNQTVQTIEASLCSPLQAKSWLVPC